jgi:hypothetical protein
MSEKLSLSSSHRVALILVALSIPAALVFAAPAAQASPGEGPGACVADSAHRQMDFWLGDWVIRFDGVAEPSTATVALSLNKCLLVESWAGPSDHNGETIFAYSAKDQLWHGMFVDNEGRVHNFEGNVTDGKGEFLGSNVGPQGEKALNRIRIAPLPGGGVEHSWEKSTDNGATWTTIFRGHYSRK